MTEDPRGPLVPEPVLLSKHRLRLGEAEFARRLKIADAKAEAICADPTCLPNESDRVALYAQVAPRLRLMAVVLSDSWSRFEAGDHQKLAWILCEAIRDGMLT